MSMDGNIFHNGRVTANSIQSISRLTDLATVRCSKASVIDFGATLIDSKANLIDKKLAFARQTA